MPMISNDDMKQIMDQMELVLVTRKSCDSERDKIDGRLNQGEVHFAKIDEKLKTITWILTAVGGGIITMLIKMFFGM
jgi:hypothetical protein